MSKFFARLNSESTKELFEKRTRYKNIVFGRGAANVVSFIDGEKIFYGRIDRKFVPIETRGNTLKPLISPADPTMAPQAFGFVTEMFRQLALQLQKQVAMGKIDGSDPFLANLKVYKAYQDPRAAYLDYMKTYSLLLKNMIYGDFNDKFKNFDEFMALLMNILETSAKNQPFTYTGFLKSKNCNVMSSGLAIEIADSTHMDDLKKYDLFVKSKNWKLFVNACNTYGFMIDYNAPWRIVADIGAPEVMGYAKLYGYSSLEHILTDGYKPASKYGLRNLAKNLFELYNFVKHTFYHEVTVCESGKVIKKRIEPVNYTRPQFFEAYDDKYFLKVYLKLRMIEEAATKQKSEKERIINHYMKMVEMENDFNFIHNKFESEINKTFDKKGSLSYSIYSDRLKTQKDFEDKKISNITITGDNENFSGY